MCVATFGETLECVLTHVDCEVPASLRAFVNWTRPAEFIACFRQTVNAVMIENHLHVDGVFHSFEINPFFCHLKILLSLAGPYLNTCSSGRGFQQTVKSYPLEILYFACATIKGSSRTPPVANLRLYVG